MFLIDLGVCYVLSLKNYAEKRAGGWEPMYESATRQYGFVDTGMRSSTVGDSIALYGELVIKYL